MAKCEAKFVCPGCGSVILLQMKAPVLITLGVWCAQCDKAFLAETHEFLLERDCYLGLFMERKEETWRDRPPML
jgi:hypothetical protein